MSAPETALKRKLLTRSKQGVYDTGPRRGVELQPILTDHLFIVGTVDSNLGDPAAGTVALTDLQQVPLLLPVPIHTIRQTVDKAFGQASLTPVVAAELDSVVIMMQAVREGLGTAILPGSARRFFDLGDLTVRRIVDPELELTVSICVSEHQPLSEPALAVHGILLELIAAFDRGDLDRPHG